MSLAQLGKQQVVSLETYKKSGDPVRSPVLVVEQDGLLFIRSHSDSWKVKRIRRNPNVRLAPSSWRGKVRGDWVRGEAHVVEGNDAKRALHLFNKKYGFLAAILNFFNRLRGRRFTVIAIKVAYVAG
jgi:uncharacterized protein